LKYGECIEADLALDATMVGRPCDLCRDCNGRLAPVIRCGIITPSTEGRGSVRG